MSVVGCPGVRATSMIPFSGALDDRGLHDSVLGVGATPSGRKVSRGVVRLPPGVVVMDAWVRGEVSLGGEACGSAVQDG